VSVPSESSIKNWWAEGDTPMRDDSRVTYLVDGRSFMLTLCLHFLRARKYIYLANWGLTPLMEIVRGEDQRACHADRQAHLCKPLVTSVQHEPGPHRGHD